jgi:hypothetical protein
MNHLKKYDNFELNENNIGIPIASNEEIEAHEKMKNAIINYIKISQAEKKYILGIWSVLDDIFTEQDWTVFKKI